MSATDELRRLLDELGVMWGDATDGDEKHTYWNNGRYWFNEYPDGFTTWHTITCGTPEQAIDATLGRAYEPRGTCHYEPDYKGFTWWDEKDVEHYEEYSASDECGSASCDKCGYSMMVGDEGWFDGWDEITEWTEEDGSEHKGYVLKPRFNFCPNCGREVIE